MKSKDNTIKSVTGRVAVIGAGPAGMSAALTSASLGLEVDWYDRDESPGGKLKGYHSLFPGREAAADVLGRLGAEPEQAGIRKHFGALVNRIDPQSGRFRIIAGSGEVEEADAVIMATGFDFVDAGRKEEFGYGIYEHVITSPDLEKILSDDPGRLRRGAADPETVAFVHCVGSRDQQAGINYCSRLCCITGIKQAIEIREQFPGCRVINFYIDMRAFGTGYEELYREAQEKHHVRFIRGRVSEASETHDGRIMLKAEDTLMAKPVKLTADWVVLLVGMVPSSCPVCVDGERIADDVTGYVRPAHPFIGQAVAGIPGIFHAGACAGPMSIPEAFASGRGAAAEVFTYLKNGK